MAAAMCVPSGEKAMTDSGASSFEVGVAATMGGRAVQLGTDHRRMRPSASPAARTSPWGEKATDTTLRWADDGGANDAFVTKLVGDGSGLVYSTFLGGTSFDPGGAIAVDAQGHAYVTGLTGSADFPTTAGAFDATFGGSSDAFVTRLSPDGSALSYSTFLGGADEDLGDGIAVERGGRAYVAGETGSADFPTAPGAFDTTFRGYFDAFVIKLEDG
jgi:hypothetical protein